MQLFAVDKEGQLIAAVHAARQSDYYCMECKGIVRLRSGVHRRKHFYHVQSVAGCRQNGKSLVHLQTQFFLSNLLPPGESFLEMHFPQIQRIADVVWKPKKWIFEIQCSSIRREEVLARNADYKKIGYQVIWIFHERRFNQKRVSSAELAVCNSPYYYTNVNQEGKGMIYDQFDLIIKGVRRCRLDPAPVHLGCPIQISEPQHRKLPFKIKNRMAAWPLAFEGDLIDQAMRNSQTAEAAAYFERALAAEKKWHPKEYASWQGKLKMRFFRCFVRPYQILLQVLLEKVAF